ncbi:MAG: type IV pilus biogenesis/stability protein PilW [Sulfuricellaceae bacterium]|nr:type IV pilus biogenesis/stability protein PilW [Sulfuricellaceae bacterium]
MRQILALLAMVAFSMPFAWSAEKSKAVSRAQAHTQLGGAYLGAGKLGVALDELKIALDADSSYAPAHNVIGLVYMELGENAKAEDHFQRSLSIDPLNSEAQNNYGWFLCQRSRYDDAVGYFLKAVKNPLYETPDKAYLNAGLCSLKNGNDKLAEEYFLKASKYQKAPPQAFLGLAEVYYLRGLYIDALYYLERFSKISESTVESLWLGVKIAHRSGNRDSEANYGLQLRKRFADSREAFALRNGEFDYVSGSGARP